MRFASIRSLDISNGIGCGVSVFLQGCHFHCKNCFNSNAWDFNGGNEWKKADELKVISLCQKEGIKRLSILGGEPLEDVNHEELKLLLENIKSTCPNITIWIYSGYTYEDICKTNKKEIIDLADVLVDGQFIYDLRDFKLKFRGSSNQRVIDLNKTREEKEIVLLDI